jgi:hypothetical protein
MEQKHATRVEMDLETDVDFVVVGSSSGVPGRNLSCSKR